MSTDPHTPLPCPRCGAAPAVVDDRTSFIVRCENPSCFNPDTGCVIAFGPSVAWLDNVEMSDEAAGALWDAVDFGRLHADAIRLWNLAAERDALRAELVKKGDDA